MSRTLQVNAAMLISTSDDQANANGSYVVGYLSAGHFWPFPGADAKTLATTPDPKQRRAAFQNLPTASVPLTSIPVPAGATNVAQVRAAAVPVLARQIVTQETVNGATIDHVLMADGTLII